MDATPKAPHQMSHQYSTKDLLMMLAGKQPDTVPPGWYSRQAVGELMQVSRTCAGETIQGLQDQGHVLETRSFKVLVAGNMLKPTPHYRFSPEAEAVLKAAKSQAGKNLTNARPARKTD
jgi:hypothetical protein